MQAGQDSDGGGCVALRECVCCVQGLCCGFVFGDMDSCQDVPQYKVVCSQHSASQDTLRDCTKCRGILAYARFKGLSRTESDEASSRSCCAQLTI